MDDYELHAHLIGRQGGRAGLNTPALVVELDVLNANILRMAKFAKANGLALRPHAKTHKSNAIARLQIAAGAVGVCCAKIGEAEAIADEGEVESILITSPVVTAPAIERLAGLHEQIEDLRVVVDNPENVAALARAMEGSAWPLGVLVDVDPGIKRTGVASAEASVELAKLVQRSKALKYLGVQFYCGREQHVASFAERRAAVAKRTDYLKGVLAALSEAGVPAGVVTGGGTGTHQIDAELDVLNELQAGSYVFMDKQYLDCEFPDDSGGPFATSLFVDASVVSANTPGMATVDAGLKAFATDGPVPVVASRTSATYNFMGDEHGAVRIADERFRIGDRVTLTAPHCDPTINLYDWLHVVRGDTLVDIWRIDARGRSR